MNKLRCWLSITALALALPTYADEGMWTYNNFPAAQVKEKYGFEPSAEWLDHLRLSSVRIAGGCSASVVSADGLVMTNHHCARSCIENLSGLSKKDYNRDGFFARTGAEEARCPGMELNRLDEISDVTARVQGATQGLPPEKFADAQRAAIATIEKGCASTDDFRCEVVTLYRGGRYDLYKYRRLQDIRLVFAPEDRIAFFGGDPDNFMFPRYDLDVTFVRIYGKDGKPMPMAQHLRWSDNGPKDGELTFVSGNPGGTSRGYTVAQLRDDRDVMLPESLMRQSELRGFITQYQERGAEQKRHSNDLLFGVENGLKAQRGRHAALADPAFFDQRAQAEQDLRARVAARPELAGQVGGAWDAIQALTLKRRGYRKEYEALERGPVSELFGLARGLVRYGDEIGKPNGERLREFSEARLPQFRQRILAKRPIYDEFEIATLTWSLTRMREQLGPDHPVIKRVFGMRSPAQIAADAVHGSRLKELVTDANGNATGGLRKALLDGGQAGIAASNDPMIELARAVDPAARAIRKKIETEIDGPLRQQQELLARARLAVYGDRQYPDATFTLRLSYGAVQGYVSGGQPVAPFTQFAGAYARHTGADPFALPASWLQARDKVNMALPLNFVTSNDIIGGNSGSPMVNRDGEVVGLIFDGNIESLGGEYGFDASANRAVAVNSAALIEALGQIYGARRLVDELTGKPAPIKAAASN